MIDNDVVDIDLSGIIPSSEVSLPDFNVRKLCDYCKENNIPLSTVTLETMRKFEQ